MSFAQVGNFSPALLFYALLGSWSPCAKTLRGFCVGCRSEWLWGEGQGWSHCWGMIHQHSLVSTGSLGEIFSFIRNHFIQFLSGVLCLPGHTERPAPLPHCCLSLCTIISHVGSPVGLGDAMNCSVVVGPWLSSFTSTCPSFPILPSVYLDRE